MKMKYKIVSSYDPETLAKEVESLLNRGWTLQGGVSMAINSNSNEKNFAQALVRDE